MRDEEIGRRKSSGRDVCCGADGIGLADGHMGRRAIIRHPTPTTSAMRDASPWPVDVIQPIGSRPRPGRGQGMGTHAVAPKQGSDRVSAATLATSRAALTTVTAYKPVREARWLSRDPAEEVLLAPELGPKQGLSHAWSSDGERDRQTPEPRGGKPSSQAKDLGDDGPCWLLARSRSRWRPCFVWTWQQTVGLRSDRSRPRHWPGLLRTARRATFSRLGVGTWEETRYAGRIMLGRRLRAQPVVVP